MEKKQIFLLLFILLYISTLFYAGEMITLPITIPADKSGIEIMPLGHTGRYQLKISFSTLNYKMSIQQESARFVIPVPSSNDWQTVTIKEIKGFEIEKIKRDRYGNTVLMTTDIAMNSLTDSFEVICTVSTRAIKYFIPKKYTCKSGINDFVLDGLKDKKREFVKQYKAPKINMSDSTADFDTLFKLIEEFKTSVNASKNIKERIYDKETLNLFPISKNQYLTATLSFISLLYKNNMYGRIVYGWKFPRKMKIFSSDFLCEVYVPGRGLIILDKYLNLYKTGGTFIAWHYDLPQVSDLKIQGYLGGIGPGNIIRCLPVEIETNGGEINSKGDITDKRYTEAVDIKTTVDIKNIKIENFINDSSVIDSTDDSFLVFTKDEKRVYSKKAKWKYLEKIVICSSFAKGKVTGIKDSYSPKQEIYAVFYFKERKTTKKVHYTWVKPDEDKKWDKKIDVNKSWRYYYTILNYKQKATMEAGRWVIEVVINGKLDGRKEFVIE